ncbi:MAG: dodecin family protein [Gemmatimonadales bacterium]
MGSIVKVVEVIAQSEKSFEDAVQTAVKETGKTVRGMRSLWIDNFSVEIKDDKIANYRVNAKVSFLVEGRK